MNTILKISNLAIGYLLKKKQKIIAKNINVSIGNPKFIALLGKNGIGKSTLLRTISKMQPSLQGQIQIEDKNIDILKPIEYAKKISVVLTEKIPPSNLTVYELIALGRQVYTDWIGNLNNDDIRKIEEVIDLVQVHAIIDKKVDELSDGQYQKALIARALAQDTPILLLDEPTAHLDIINKAEIFKLLKQLVIEKQKTIIISSHELQLAIQTADDLWLMNEEEFVSGNKLELITNNALQNLFTSDIVSFDEELKQFIFC